MEDSSMHATAQYLFMTPCYLIVCIYNLIQYYWKEPDITTTVGSILLGLQQNPQLEPISTHHYMKSSMSHMDWIKGAVNWCILSKSSICIIHNSFSLCIVDHICISFLRSYLGHCLSVSLFHYTPNAGHFHIFFGHFEYHTLFVYDLLYCNDSRTSIVSLLLTEIGRGYRLAIIRTFHSTTNTPFDMVFCYHHTTGHSCQITFRYYLENKLYSSSSNIDGVFASDDGLHICNLEYFQNIYLLSLSSYSFTKTQSSYV
jgi:hypothetical protein